MLVHVMSEKIICVHNSKSLASFPQILRCVELMSWLIIKTLRINSVDYLGSE